MNLHPGQTKGEGKPRLGLCCSYQVKREGVYIPFPGSKSLEQSQEQCGHRWLLALSKCSTGTDFDEDIEILILISLYPQSFPGGMERSIHGAGDRAPPVLGTCEESSLGEEPVPLAVAEESHRVRDDSRDLVHAPLPSTWRRSSLPNDSPGDLRQREAEHLLRAGQPHEVHPLWSLAPASKPRRELRRASLNMTPVPYHPAIIDVRKNPL